MGNRRAARTDANQQEIVDAFRGVGASVSITSACGDGFPDIVVGKYGITVLVEIKDGAKPPSARKLTKDQVKFHEDWQGWIEVVENVLDALLLMSRMHEIHVNKR